MSNRKTSRADFEEFVVVCSERLLRTAYLLVHDRDVAERLLQDALARASLSWGRLDEQPESYVRRLLVRSALKQPVRPAGVGDGLWDRLSRLTRRQRAVVVLRYLDDLSVGAAADLLGCSESTVRVQAAGALEALGVDPTLPAPARQAEGAA